MNKLLNYLKKNRIPVPISFGLALAKIPYNNRPGLGKLYKEQQRAISSYNGFSEEEKQAYIYRKFMKVFEHAYNNIPFYQDLYRSEGLSPQDISSFSDLKKVPIINKKDLLEYDIEYRSYPIANRLVVNTGGSSGKPFSFYMDPGRYGNEWAHIHDMWGLYGYKQSDLKLSFDGRAKKNNNIVYDFARNSLLYDIYSNPDILRNRLLRLARKYSIKYLHGYPSAIYEFALYCESDSELNKILSRSLKAAFLSSEFPSPHYRDKIESVFEIPTQAFYGHTETCIMAPETEKYVYKPYQTYGFAEAIPYDDTYHLVGTSYFNFASPLIRYDTSDLIEPISKNQEILGTFRIKEGRTGEFILDRKNKKIPLTGLIYGRHHKLFNVCNHIQVAQEKPGKATIYYVTKNNIDNVQAANLFDSSSIEIDFHFKRIEQPILTKSGKTNLLIKVDSQ